MPDLRRNYAMARLIRSDATGPHRLDPQGKPVFVCACWLSQNLPFCDGSHKATKGERPGTLYVYDAARRNVVEEKRET